MNKKRPAPRMIVTRGSNTWLAELPDDDEINARVIEAFGKIVPLPLPYTSAADFGTVRAGLALSHPNHTVLRATPDAEATSWLVVIPRGPRLVKS